MREKLGFIVTLGMRLAVRTVDGHHYFLSPREIRTPGLATLTRGQRVQFRPDGDAARQVRRLPSLPEGRWEEARQAMSDPESGWLAARVKTFKASHDLRRAFGFARLEVSGAEVFFRASSFIRRDREDVVGFRGGERVFVRLKSPPRGHRGAPIAFEVFCLEE